MVKKGENSNIEYIDLLRVVSMFSVVMLHVMSGTLWTGFGSLTWHGANILSTIMSASVPIFFMISGATLLGSEKTNSISYTLKKRFPKLFVPFLGWSFMAIVYYFLLQYSVSGNFDRSIILSRLLYMPSQATTIHLWFMYAIIPLYLISPLLKRMVDGLDEKSYVYGLFLWFIFSSLLPTVSSFISDAFRPLFVLNREFSLHFLGGYLGYFLAGYYFHRFEKKIEKKILLLLLGSAIFLNTMLISWGTWWRTLNLGSYDESFKVYSGVFTVGLSLCVFLFFKEWIREKPFKKTTMKFLKFLSQISFGIYLLHNLLVDYLSNLIPLWPANSFAHILLSFLIVLVSSILIVVILVSIKPTCFLFTGISYEQASKSCNIQYFWGKFKTQEYFFSKARQERG
jgi:surface polysaccharide O-acyltransferase-like enzyme